MKGELLTVDEQIVLQTLADAWNGFLELPEELHVWERQEFMHAIHSAQRIVMSRPVMRQVGKKDGVTAGELLAAGLNALGKPDVRLGEERANEQEEGF